MAGQGREFGIGRERIVGDINVGPELDDNLALFFVQMRGPYTLLKLDAPARLVAAEFRGKNHGHARCVSPVHNLVTGTIIPFNIPAVSRPLNVLGARGVDHGNDIARL